MTVEITVNAWQYRYCVDVAAMRMATSNVAGLNHSSTYSRDYLQRLQEETVGACGELCAAKALNVFWWPSINEFHHTSDLPGDIEVRTTCDKTNSLIIRNNDPDHRAYVLVTGRPPTMTVVGWMTGADAKQDRFLRDPHKYRPAWFVPQSALVPIHVLARHVASQSDVHRQPQ